MADQIHTKQCRRCFLVLEQKDFYAKRATCKFCLSKGVRGRPKKPKEIVQRVIELRNQDQTYRQIALTLGISFATVGRIIRTANQ